MTWSSKQIRKISQEVFNSGKNKIIKNIKAIYKLKILRWFWKFISLLGQVGFTFSSCKYFKTKSEEPLLTTHNDVHQTGNAWNSKVNYSRLSVWIRLYYDFIHYHITEDITLFSGMLIIWQQNYHTLTVSIYNTFFKSPRFFCSHLNMYGIINPV